MNDQPPMDPTTGFLGQGWTFPPRFEPTSGEVVLSAGEEDIEASLRILFSTASGERFLNPTYGLDMHETLFEPMSTTMRTLLQDRVKVAILIFEPRINPLELRIDSPDPNDGQLRIVLEYEVRSTNSRYNLVFPFYRTDANEARRSVTSAAELR